MEMTYYLAVDIGASSGRHMLSHLEDGKLVLEEIYRFPNCIRTAPLIRYGMSSGCLRRF